MTLFTTLTIVGAQAAPPAPGASVRGAAQAGFAALPATSPRFSSTLSMRP